MRLTLAALLLSASVARADAPVEPTYGPTLPPAPAYGPEAPPPPSLPPPPEVEGVTTLEPIALPVQDITARSRALVNAMVLTARAQATVGTIELKVLDRATGQGVESVTAVVTGPALEGSIAELTADDGVARLGSVPEGDYELVLFYGDKKLTKPGVTVRAGQTTSVLARITVSQEE